MPILIQKFWGGHGVLRFLQVPGDAGPLVFEFPLLAKVESSRSLLTLTFLWLYGWNCHVFVIFTK